MVSVASMPPKRYFQEVAVIALFFAVVSVLTRGVVVLPDTLLVHPASAIPLPATLLFGTAGAWGAALGVLIRDMASGALGFVSLFEAAAHFLLGFLGLHYWNAFQRSKPRIDSRWLDGRTLVRLSVVVVGAASGAAAFLAWGREILSIAPFHITAFEATIDYMIVTLSIGIALLLAGTKIVRHTDHVGGVNSDARAAERMGPWFSSNPSVVLIPISWLLIGTVGSIGYGLLESISPQDFYDRGVGVLLVVHQPVLFGPGAVNVQAVFGSVMAVLLLGTTWNRSAERGTE